MRISLSSADLVPAGPSRDAEPKPDRWTSNTPVAKSAGVAAQVAQVSQILEQQRMASQPPPPGMGPPLLSRAASGGAGMVTILTITKRFPCVSSFIMVISQPCQLYVLHSL